MLNAQLIYCVRSTTTAMTVICNPIGGEVPPLLYMMTNCHLGCRRLHQQSQLAQARTHRQGIKGGFPPKDFENQATLR